jgi:hypothetical protein
MTLALVTTTAGVALTPLMSGVFALAGGAISGWLSDRWDNRLLLFSYHGIRTEFFPGDHGVRLRVSAGP